MAELTRDHLQAVVTDGDFALARITAAYEPAAGDGSRIFPPTFPTTATNPVPYLLEDRVRDGERVRAVVLDQVPSQANRAEEALSRAQREGRVTLPLIRLAHMGQTHVVMTGLDFPHRVFDAYLRDSMLDGKKFDLTDLGKRIQATDHDDATVLLRHDPGTIAYGGWNSHRKGRQTKFPRQYASEVIGWNPVVGSRKAGRMDPNNLSGSRTGEGDDWTYSAVSSRGAKAKLSEIGHGNIAPNDAHGGVTVEGITRFATLSLTGLKRIRFGGATARAHDAAHTLLAAYALLGDRLAFGGPSLWLRSGCELLPTAESLSWHGRNGASEAFTLEPATALEVFEQARLAADEARRRLRPRSSGTGSVEGVGCRHRLQPDQGRADGPLTWRSSSTSS